MIRLRVQVHTAPSAFEQLRDEWRALEAQARPRVPFRAWDWNVAWWAAFAERRAAVRDELALRTFRDENGTLVGVAPLFMAVRPAGGPLQVRSLELFGADPNITELRGVLAAPGRELELAQALCDELRADAATWDWFVWHGVPVDVEPALGWKGHEVLNTSTAFELPLPATWEELKSGLARNMKEALRKCYNSLKRDGHAFTFRVASTPEEIAPLLERFLALHSARAAVGDGVQHADAFSSVAARAFLRDIMNRMALLGRARVFAIEIGGEIVAMRLAFVCGDALYLYYSGYDPAWGKYSVMTTCVAEAIQYAIREKLAAVHLSMGRDNSKTRWQPQEVQHRELLLVSPTLRAPIARSVYRFARERLPKLPLVARILHRRAP